MAELTRWNIYEVSTSDTQICGVKFRGRVRKASIELGIELLVENATDCDNIVRIAVHSHHGIAKIEPTVLAIAQDACIALVVQNVVNPVLSKLAVNQTNRYDV